MSKLIKFNTISEGLCERISLTSVRNEETLHVVGSIVKVERILICEKIYK
jgi:hypothetical protein